MTSMWWKLKDKARVCYGIEIFEYGMREFAIYDNNGYLLQFGQEFESQEIGPRKRLIDIYLLSSAFIRGLILLS